jgi:alpha,alpha-trehalase
MSLELSKSQYDAVIFDLDGVITKTADVHARAWKRTFDEYLKGRTDLDEETARPFEIEEDYRVYVDGKPRYEGVRSFLESRGIDLPYGDPSDPPGVETICGIGNRKNDLFRKVLSEEGVEVYGSTIDLIKSLRDAGIKTAVVTSSKNCPHVLEAAGIANLFDVKVDGGDSARLGLKGKPDPDIFVEAAKDLGVKVKRCVVVEDAVSGVQAGRAGEFGCVVGVDRTGHPAALKEAGADVVVSDLAEVSLGQGE